MLGFDSSRIIAGLGAGPSNRCAGPVLMLVPDFRIFLASLEKSYKNGKLS